MGARARLAHYYYMCFPLRTHLSIVSVPFARLKYVPKPRMRVCMLGDQAAASAVPYKDADWLKKLNKEKKAVKKLGTPFTP